MDVAQEMEKWAEWAILGSAADLAHSSFSCATSTQYLYVHLNLLNKNCGSLVIIPENVQYNIIMVHRPHLPFETCLL